MNTTALKRIITRTLREKGIKKSEVRTSRVKGFPKATTGFDYTLNSLRWRWGFGVRMPVEQTNRRMQEIYHILQESKIKDWVELRETDRQGELEIVLQEEPVGTEKE